jgi:DNA-binding PadR family transcriptional regulator
MRLATLLLLADEPRNGYQLMQAIEDRTAGRWRPSPGSVYPTLAQLEDEGLIQTTERDGTKVFELTPAGREYVAAQAAATAPWEQGDAPGEKARHELRALARQVMMATRQVIHAGDEGQVQRAGEMLAQTRRALYRILADDAAEGAETAEAPGDAQAAGGASPTVDSQAGQDPGGSGQTGEDPAGGGQAGE